MNGAHLITLFYIVYYIALEPIAGLLYVPCLLALNQGALLFLNNNQQAIKISVGIHVASWILQFIGHGVFEKRAPALFDSLLQALLLAPLFVFVEVLFLVGYRPALRKRLETQYRVVVFDKGQRLGGRCAFRTIDSKDIDIGAIAFKADKGPFLQLIKENPSLVRKAPANSLVRFEKGSLIDLEKDWYFATKTTNHLLQSIAKKLEATGKFELHQKYTVNKNTGLKFENFKWTVGSHSFDKLVLTFPSAFQLDFVNLPKPNYSKCIVLMAPSNQPLNTKLIEFNGHRVFLDKNCLVLQLNPQISSSLFESDTFSHLLVELIEPLGIHVNDLNLDKLLIKKWKYAQITTLNANDNLKCNGIELKEKNLIVIGDAFSGSDLQSVYNSAFEMADLI